MTEEAQAFVDNNRIILTDYVNERGNQRLFLDIKGKLVLNRLLMIAKQIFITDEIDNIHFLDDARNRDLIKTEIDYLPSIVHERINIASWMATVPGKFYKLDSDWSAELVKDFPTFENVTDAETYCNLSISGGGVKSRVPFTELPFTDSQKRWQYACEWAASQQEQALRGQSLEPSAQKRRTATVYFGLLCNNLLAASNEANRTDDAKWTKLQTSMVQWQEFSKDVKPENINSILPSQQGDGNIDLSVGYHEGVATLYERENIYLYNPETKELEQVRGTEVVTPEANAPDVADVLNVYEVRATLGHSQDVGVSLADLTGITVNNDQGVVIAQLIPVFSKDVIDYYTSVPNSTTVVHIDVTADANPIIQYNKMPSLNAGNNELPIISKSQDQSMVSSYILHISRLPVPNPSSARLINLAVREPNSNRFPFFSLDDADITFSPDMLRYAMSVPPDVSSIEIIAIAENARAAVTLPDLNLITGLNTKIVSVRSSDLSTSTAYILAITRESA